MPDARILIVEDEAIESMDLQQRLAGLGYPLPDIAYTGEEGVRKAEQTQPDLILMDIMMPGKLDGVAAAEQIRSRFDIPIIFLTAYADENTLSRAKITAPYGYIVKPFQERELHITIDMTLYRHKMERELRKREKWLATTLRSIGDAVIATDKKGLITFINPVAEALMGCKLEDVQQRNLMEVFNIVNRETRKPVENPVTRVLLEGNIVGLANHTILISMDGKEIPINDSAAPIKDDQGNILGVILVFSDISEREKAAESLRESQKENEFLAGLIRASSQPVAIGYPDGRLGLFNRAFEELTGYAADELRSINWAAALTPPEWLAMERDKLAELHRTGQSVRYEKEYIRKDGTCVPVELLVHLVSDSEGKPQYYYAFLTDLTERKQAEEKVIKLNEELRRKVAELSVANTSLRDSRKATLNIMEDALAARKRAEDVNAELLQEVTERKRAEEALRESELRVRRKLESVLSPEGDIGNLELGDIIDPPALQSLVDNLYKFVHLPIGIIDLKGKVLVGAGWQDICTKFHRAHPDACRHCMESDLELTKGVSPGEFKLYKCKNGMWDAVTPLMVGGQHMGNLFWGQFFFDDETVDREIFRAQARKYSFNEDEYLVALDKVPRISREALDTGMAFYLKLADILSKLSYSNIKLAQTLSVRDNLLHSLREGEERLKRAQEISHLGSWELDLVNNRLTWSDEVYRIFGLQPQEFDATYGAFLEAVHPDDRAAVDAAYSGSIREEKDTYEIEHRVVRKSTEEIRHVLEKCQHFRDETGKIIKSVGMVHDITERKKALEVQGRLAAIVESAGDAIIGKDLNGIIQTWNVGAEKIFGYKAEEVIGKSVSLLVPPGHTDEVPEILRRIIQGEHIEDFETVRMRKDGTIIPVSLNFSAIRDSNGKVIGASKIAHDITERKRVEEVLRQSEERFRALTMASSDVVYRMSPDWSEMRQLSGRGFIADTENPSRNWLQEYIHPADQAHVKAVIDEAIRTESIFELEHRVLRVDGTLGWTYSLAIPLLDTRGEIVEWLGAASDITERKIAEQTLHQLNRTLQALSRSDRALLYATEEAAYLQEICQIIVENCGHAMVWVGFAEHDEARSVRPAASAGFDAGYLDTLELTWADTERGRGPTGIAIRTGRVAMCRNMQTDPQFGPWRAEAIKRGYASSAVFPLLTDGQAFGALTIYSREPEGFSDDEVKLLTDLAGDFAYGITTLRLRAKHAAIEAALRESEERYRSLFENMLHGFAYCKMLYDEGGRPSDFIYLNVNSAFGKITGLENVVGRRVTEVIPGIREAHSELFDIYGRVASTGRPENVEIEFKPLGVWLSISVYSTLREHFVAIFDDITERKKAETDIMKLSEDLAIRNMSLESVNKELESFIYSVSHDLRAPIRTMSGFAKIINEDYAGKLDAQGQDYLNRILKGSEKSTQLINDLLRLSMISRQGLDKIDVNLSNKVSKVVEELRQTDQGRNVEVVVQEGLTASADPTLIELALSNLLGNAWKFTSETGTPRIEFGRVVKKGKTVYYVKDNGAGFDMTYADKMFLPFHRLHTDKEFEGTGIGLTIVERIIRRHGGKVWAEGEVGKGATLYFTL